MQDPLEILNTLPEALCIVDCSTGLIVQVNKTFENLLMKENRATKMHFLNDLFKQEQREQLEVTIRLLSETANSVFLGLLQTLTFHGDTEFPVYRFFEWFSVRLNPTTLMFTGRKSSKTRNNLPDQQNFESELVDFFQNAPIALHWLGSNGNILWANKKELETLGYSAEEYIGHSVMEFCPDEKTRVLETFRLLASNVPIANVPFKFRTKTGELKYFLIDSNVSMHTDGTFKHTRCFIRDDTSRQIQIALEKLEKLNAQKVAEERSIFLRRLFHEMRTPLFGFLELLDTPTISSEDVDVLRGLAEFMSSMLGDFAFATEFENGRLQIAVPTPTDLNDLISDIIEYCKRHKQRQGHAVLFTVNCAGIPAVNVDPRLLQRALTHLIANAVVHSAEPGDVRVDVQYRAVPSSSSAELIFKVTNNVAQALSEHHINAYFRKMYQSVKESTKQKDPATDGLEDTWDLLSTANFKLAKHLHRDFSSTKGLGLGLYVAFSAVQTLGSLLECSFSDHEAQFWFSLKSDVAPVLEKQVLADVVEKRPVLLDQTSTNHNNASLSTTQGEEDLVSQQFLRPTSRLKPLVRPLSMAGRLEPLEGSSAAAKHVKGVPLTSSRAKKSARSPRSPRSRQTSEALVPLSNELSVAQLAGHAIRVLVVDDSPICQKVVSKALVHQGCRVQTASNGLEACEMLSMTPQVFDIVLMDLRMPIMDGFTAIQKARNELKLNIPIIALSAEIGEDSRQAALNAGANSFLSKPVKAQVLGAEVTAQMAAYLSKTCSNTTCDETLV